MSVSKNVRSLILLLHCKQLEVIVCYKLANLVWSMAKYIMEQLLICICAPPFN